MNNYRKILVAFDGSPGAVDALLAAVGLARHGGEVTALWVADSLPHYYGVTSELKASREAMHAFGLKLRHHVNALSEKLGFPIAYEQHVGHVAGVLTDFAQKGDFDLLVVGHSGHSKLWGRLLGHTADRVSESAHCSVLIVRRAKPARPGRSRPPGGTRAGGRRKKTSPAG